MCREAKSGDRDVFNEKPTREDQAMVVAHAAPKAALATGCTIHTSMGDIVSSTLRLWDGPDSQRLKLLPDIAPKAVENFITHAKNGYFNGIVFHRIIRKFVSGAWLGWVIRRADTRCCKRETRWVGVLLPVSDPS